jgi:Tfp pilus assembly protein PilO
MNIDTSFFQKIQDFIKSNIKMPSKSGAISIPTGGLGDDTDSVNRNLLIALGLVVVSIVTIMTTIYYPYKDDINALERKYKKIAIMRNEIAQINGRLDIEGVLLQEKRREYEKITRIFHSESELEELYESISKLAIRYGLKVAGFSRKKPEAIYEVVTKKKKKKKKRKKRDRKITHYKMKVNINMSGNYLTYMKFRAGLADLKKAVNTEKETINMDNEDGGGNVKVHLVLSTYRLP